MICPDLPTLTIVLEFYCQSNSFVASSPVDKGKKKGYFNDTTTRVLLDLNPRDTLLHSGTYGDKELSVKPIKLTTLRSQDFDCRILPFTPANHAFTSTYITMHKRNGQYPVLAQTR